MGQPRLSIISRSADNVILKVDIDIDISTFKIALFEVYEKQKQKLVIKREIEIGDSLKPTFTINELQPSTKYCVQVVLIKDDKSKTAPSKDLEFQTIAKNKDFDLFLNPSKIEEERNRLVQYFRNLDTQSQFSVDKLNFLCIGPLGSGKSSFFNTLHYIFNCQPGQYSPITATNGQLEMVTKELTKIPIIKGKESLVGWDLYGETNDNYDTVLEAIIKGFHEAGHRRGDEAHRGKNDVDIDHIPHSVIIFVSSLSSYSKESLDRIKQLNDVLVKNHIQPVLFLTKVDIFEGSDISISKNNIEDIHKSPMVYSIISAISENTGFPIGYIFPIVNYCDSATLNYAIELLALRALEQALFKSKITIEKWFKDHPEKKSPRQEKKEIPTLSGLSISEKTVTHVEVIGEGGESKGKILQSFNLKADRVSDLKESLEEEYQYAKDSIKVLTVEGVAILPNEEEETCLEKVIFFEGKTPKVKINMNQSNITVINLSDEKEIGGIPITDLKPNEHTVHDH